MAPVDPLNDILHEILLIIEHVRNCTGVVGRRNALEERLEQKKA